MSVETATKSIIPSSKVEDLKLACKLNVLALRVTLNRINLQDFLHLQVINRRITLGDYSPEEKCRKDTT
jgi:hypothetical protein